MRLSACDAPSSSSVLSLNLSEEAADLLVEKGWDPAMGARPLRRAIQRYIEDPLADFVLNQSFPEGGGTVLVKRAPEGDDRDVLLEIAEAPERKQPVAVGGSDSGSEEKPDEGALDTPPVPETEAE